MAPFDRPDPAPAPATAEADDAQALRFTAPDALDRAIRAAFIRAFSGASPFAAAQAYGEWLARLLVAPARAGALTLEAARAAQRVAAFALDPEPSRAKHAPFAPEPDDRRFRDEAWRRAPFDVFVQAQLAMEAWWRDAVSGTPGLAEHQGRRVEFLARQMLNAFAPVNVAALNPEVVSATLQSGGRNLTLGWRNWVEDGLAIATRGLAPGLENYEIGRNLAATPGKVVFRNDLIELIQYAPSTPTVRREPILIVPAWIMKYYILDLGPDASFVNHLVDQGFTVFCISWKNPGPEMRDLSLDDYRLKGVMPAIDIAAASAPGEGLHAVGYCLGGTILSIAAAAMARDGDKRLATMSLLAAQTDFSEAGELLMFIDEAQVSALEDVMDKQGYLDARQMSAAFYALRANEMLWARFVERYLIGERRAAGPLEYWLSDATRMPARMHSQYLRWLFLENRLVEGRLHAGERVVHLKDINIPVFAVGAEKDHIAPWRSVHKIGLFAGSETTFLLTGGGHNSGIVSPPGKPGAHHRLRVIASCTDYDDPDDWLPSAPRRDGSWWPAFVDWLGGRSAIDRVSPPGFAADLGPAPGVYVREP